MNTDDVAQWKKNAAEYAVRYVRPKMTIGLGGGTTAHYAVLRIAELLRNGELADIRAVPCSSEVERTARSLGVPLTTLEDSPTLDLTIDGADEVAPNLNVIKGRGGALLREKIVAQVTKRMIIAVDESKLVPKLGTHAPLPVEVVPFGWRTQANYLETLGAKCILRRDENGQPFLTDEQNYILDCTFGPISAVDGLAVQLQAHAGIVAHGLFLGLAHQIIVAGPQGIREIE